MTNKLNSRTAVHGPDGRRPSSRLAGGDSYNTASPFGDAEAVRMDRQFALYTEGPLRFAISLWKARNAERSFISTHRLY